MEDKYVEWIEKNVSEDGGYGKCLELIKKMSKEFPELIICRGFYYCPIWGRRTHWWLKKIDGAIIDPTANQFPSKGKFEYEELSDDELEDRVPTGVCVECGKPVYHNKTFCSETCECNTIAYLNNIDQHLR